MESSHKIKRFEDLHVWQKAQDVGEIVYQLSMCGALAKDFTMKDQLRRAALSISSNIAEGQGRLGPKEFRYFLSIANGSAYEVISIIRFSKKIGYLSPSNAEKIIEMCSEISRMIKGLRKSIKF